MSTPVFLIVLLAALLHASWNAFVKGGADKDVAMMAVVLGHLPFTLLSFVIAPLPDPASLPYILGGIGLHVGYQLFLMTSYRLGDLTQVYPIARGSAPLIVAVVSVFALGVTLPRAELLSILLIVLGILSLLLVRHADGRRNGRAAIVALITGGFIAAYSLVDGIGARIAGTALGFYAWLSLGNIFVLSVIMAVWKPQVFRRVATNGKSLFLLGGGASFAAYALVMWAFTQAPIALVTALRECSIVFALLIGVVFLKERLSLVKLAATVTTLMGVVLLRLSNT